MLAPSSLQQPHFSEQAGSQRMANITFRGEGGTVGATSRGTAPYSYNIYFHSSDYNKSDLERRNRLLNSYGYYIRFPGCGQKLSQTTWFKIMDIYFLVLEARSLKWRCQQSHPPSETLGGILLASPELVVVAIEPWYSLADNFITLISASAIAWHSPWVSEYPLLSTLLHWIKSLTYCSVTVPELTTSAKILVTNKVTCWGPRV